MVQFITSFRLMLLVLKYDQPFQTYPSLNI